MPKCRRRAEFQGSAVWASRENSNDLENPDRGSGGDDAEAEQKVETVEAGGVGGVMGHPKCGLGQW